MELLFRLKGISTTETEDHLYLHTEDLLNNNMLMRISNIYDENEIVVRRMVSILHYNEIDAGNLTISNGSFSPIELYRIILDIFSLYKENPITTFLRIIQDLRISEYSSFKQITLENENSVRNQIIREFDLIRSQ
ncbi:hypothetical protein [Paenibacillus ferrarius]|nr:hypothetical protein [Paenibacillus ferrarius]